MNQTVPSNPRRARLIEGQHPLLAQRDRLRVQAVLPGQAELVLVERPEAVDRALRQQGLQFLSSWCQAPSMRNTADRLFEAAFGDQPLARSVLA